MKKKVLVTGGAGFIAHHLIGEILKNTDWEIISLDRLDYSGNLNRLNDLLVTNFDEQTRKRVKVVFHDLKAQINPFIKSEIGEVNYILHLAAGSHVDRSILYPMEFVLDNVVGTCNILEFARSQDNLDRFLYFSTDEVFGPAPDKIKFEENDRYNSTNPYSATKAGGEELCVAYHNTYGLPVYITHTMNVFGERQHSEKFIPLCIKKIKNGEVVTIHSNSTKTIPGSRHYIHAEDVSSAVLFLLNYSGSLEPTYGGAKCPKFNIVGAEELNNLELAQMIAEIQNKPLKYQLADFHSSRPGHDLRYALDGDKMKSLGWSTKKTIKERIFEVVNWTLKHDRWINS
jgi:dTDP-glucose 4,6-dehydratase